MSQIVPPDSWRLHTEHGYMGRDSSPEGRVVRLHDVIHWLRESRGISLDEACQEVLDEITPALKPFLFNLIESGFATPFDGNEDFSPGGFHGESFPDGHWLDSLKTWLCGMVGPDGEYQCCGEVAILMTKAHELWDYGTLTTDAPLNMPDAQDAATIDPATLVPHDGWALRSGWGYMSRDGTPAGRLVRLADVVRWLMDTSPLPRPDVVAMVANALTPAVLTSLYVLDKNGGKPASVSPECGFGYMTPSMAEAKQQRARQEARTAAWNAAGQGGAGGWVTRGMDVAPLRHGASKAKAVTVPTVEPGAPALATRIRALWTKPNVSNKHGCEILDNPGEAISWVAILMTKAHELWGYGAPSDQPATIGAMAGGPQPAQPQALPLATALEPDPFEALNEDQRRRMKELTDTDKTDLVKLREELKRPPGKTGRAKNWTPWQRVTANHLQGKIGMDALAVILGRDVNTLTDTLDVDKVTKAAATLNRQSGGPSLAVTSIKRP